MNPGEKVYVVTTGSYSDKRIYGIYADEKAADIVAAMVDDSNGVEEWELGTVRGSMPIWTVEFDKDGVAETPRQYGAEEEEIYLWEKGGTMDVKVKAASAEKAMKKAIDRRTEYLAKAGQVS